MLYSKKYTEKRKWKGFKIGRNKSLLKFRHQDHEVLKERRLSILVKKVWQELVNEEVMKDEGKQSALGILWLANGILKLGGHFKLQG